MRPAHVVASGRLLRWFFRLIVVKNRNVSNTQPLNETASWTPAPMFLQGNVSIRPPAYFHSTKNATNNITLVCEVKSCGCQLICIHEGYTPGFICFRRSASLFKFKCFRFILGGSGTYTKSSLELHSTHMFRQLVTNWCFHGIHFSSRVTYWLYLFTSRAKPINIPLHR